MTKQDAPTTTDADSQSRAEFEAWYCEEGRKAGFVNMTSIANLREPDGFYGAQRVALNHKWEAWQAARASSAAAQPVSLGELAEREIKDAIRLAYDLGYEDARNARAVPGDRAPEYKGQEVERDHGGALLARLRTLPAPPAKPADTGEAPDA